MTVLIAILCFLNGAVLASCFFIALGRGKPPEQDANRKPTESEKKAIEMGMQWENFMNYDGTTRGQKQVRYDD